MTVPIVIARRPGPFDSRVLRWLKQSDQPVIVHEAQRENLDQHFERNRCKNIARARNAAFRKALSEHPSAEFFLSLDDDVLPPPGAIGIMLAAAELGVISAWIPGKRAGFSGGVWVRKNTFAHFEEVRPGLTETHLVSLGCTLIYRDLVEGHEFGSGTDLFCFDLDGQKYHAADSGAFSEHVLNSGGRMFLSAGVVAEHLTM